MRTKRMRCAGLAVVMLVCSLFCGHTAVEARADTNEEISAEDVSVTWEDSHIYNSLTLGKYKTVTTYGVKGYEDVPFLSVHAYMNSLCGGQERILCENGTMHILMNGAEAVIDPSTDTIRIDNTARFRSLGRIDGAIIEDDEFNVITVSEKHEAVQGEAATVSIDLKAYHMPVIPYEDTILMPFLALQNIFGSIMMKNVLAYNGKDYFNVFEAEKFVMEQENGEGMESPYIKAIYSGPFSEKKEASQAYADYGYYSTCLLLDLTFGHKEERNITSFDEYFTRLNAGQAMRSTNPATAVTAEFVLFNYLFGSGHDTLMTPGNVFGAEGVAAPDEVSRITDEMMESEEGRKLVDELGANSVPPVPADADAEAAANAIIGALLEKGFKLPEVVPLLVWSEGIGAMKPEDYGDERLDYAGDTAVIYFNSFKDDTVKRDPSYYLDPVKEEDAEKSSFAFFYLCFEDIKQHEEVKNVVINIADNGGGAAAALVSVLGFLSDDGEVRITDQDLMSGNYREEWYHVDTNLDGIADDKDGYGDAYDFYILCSGSSYSCGNALPYFAGQDGLASVIGTQPGGGDCVVANFVDAYGRCAFYSGMLKLGREEGGVFESNEKAVVPDLNMMPSILDIRYVPWFDAEGIADAVHRYQNGETVMSYNEMTDEEKLAEYLNMLMEKIGQSMEEQAAGQ